MAGRIADASNRPSRHEEGPAARLDRRARATTLAAISLHCNGLAGDLDAGIALGDRASNMGDVIGFNLRANVKVALASDWLHDLTFLNFLMLKTKGDSRYGACRGSGFTGDRESTAG